MLKFPRLVAKSLAAVPTYSYSDVYFRKVSVANDLGNFTEVQQRAAIDQLKAMIETLERGTREEQEEMGVFVPKLVDPQAPHRPHWQVETGLVHLRWELADALRVSAYCLGIFRITLTDLVGSLYILVVDANTDRGIRTVLTQARE